MRYGSGSILGDSGHFFLYGIQTCSDGICPQLFSASVGGARTREEQIAQQTLESLTRVDEALENTDPFKLPGRAGFKFLTFEISTEITRAQLYAVLLERKKINLGEDEPCVTARRMRELQEAIETTVENPGVRDC